MTTPNERAQRFLELHRGPTPLLMPNAWDIGSAKLLESLGFEALATTSSGFAATLGRVDGSVTRDEALAHAEAIAAATDVPVSADLEDCFAVDPGGVAETVKGAVAAGAAGCSVEDYTRRPDDPIFDLAHAKERVAAAAEAAHGGPVPLVLTARSENFIRGRRDLADTVARLQAYQGAGADVLFAPGVIDPTDLRSLLASVDRPVNVLAMPGTPTVAELGELGVKRISVGGAFAYAAYGALVQAARELREAGTYSYWETARAGGGAVRSAFA
jgi:2-methylisocitrate lyase-like PEP mutase family enzyme